MMIFLIILFICLSIFLAYTLIMALDRISALELTLINIYNIIRIAGIQLDLVDANGAFESDDDVGFIFEEIKHIQNELNNLFETEESDGEKAR